MHSIAQLSTKDLKAYSKFAQLYSVTYDVNGQTNFTAKQAKCVINKEGNINFRVPSFRSITWDEDFVDGTLLHIAWNSYGNEITQNLLDLGADYTIKSKSGKTALLLNYNKCSSESNEFLMYQNDSYINSILSAHIKFANPSNPCDNDGLSHFHIACLANHVKAVEFFLENGVDVNQMVDGKGIYPGFTPLHFAVDRCSLETVELLLKYGADSRIKNCHGMSPLHELLRQRMEILGSMIRLAAAGLEDRKTLEDRLQVIDKIIQTLLGIDFLNKVQILDDTGLSSFHVACTMQDLPKIESLLEKVKEIDHCVNMKSRTWPGYTALHFAASCNSINVIQLLVCKRGASMDLKNAEGLTPFDICVKLGCLRDIYSVIVLKPDWANICFSDNKTTLVNFLSAMQDTKMLNNFLCSSVDDVNMKLPDDSPLWPGCSPLHLAVIMFNEKESTLGQIKELLSRGVDVTQKNASNETPLHHAFRNKNNKIIKLLYSHHRSSINPADGDNLSHLHIACAQNDENLVEKILSSSNIDVNIRYEGEDLQNVKTGWTPLRCVTWSGRIKEMLLQHGAKDFFEKRYDSNTLHSACDRGDEEAVQRLLEFGADVNCTLDDGCTPLHLAIERKCAKVVELLLQRGADLIIKDNDGETPLSRVFGKSSKDNVNVYRRLVYSVLKQHEEMQRRMEKVTGITMLHIACHMLDLEEVRGQLARGTDVNARVHEDSKLWPGCVALHALMAKVNGERSTEEVLRDARVITELLLDNRADVTIANVDGNTALHASYNCFDEDAESRTKSLLRRHHNFRINPVNGIGLSHFHLAVILNDVEVVEKFLEHGVNVNQPMDYFELTEHKGFGPLLMAVCYVNCQETLCDTPVIDLLLSYGADVNLEDSLGRSAFHEVLDAGSLRLHLMKKLHSYGADINSVNLSGRTPFEKILRSKYATVKDIQFFLQRGCRANVYNPVNDEGYLGIVLSKKDEIHRDLLIEELIRAPDVSTVNDMGRTVIHNVVAVIEPAITSNEYVRLFKRFKHIGHDVDDQDRKGQTALHLAAQFGNHKAILALLDMGADLNIVDSKGKSALSYAVEFCLECDYSYVKEHHRKTAIKALVLQLNKLKFFHLHVSKLNSDLITTSFEILKCTDMDLDKKFYLYGLEVVKNFTIEPLSLTLNDFLSESKAVINYCRMSEFKRDVIDLVFEKIGNNFKEVLPLLTLQYRKAVTRVQFAETVSIFLKDLAGFSLPDLCTHYISRFLSISDLKKLAVASNLAT